MKLSKSRPLAATRAPGLLCGTDFSENARQAADVAATLARHWGVPLRLVHATPIPASRTVQEDLKAESARLRSSGALEFSSELLVGDADEVLVAQAASATTRLIIVSSLGRRAPTRWLLGSVAERTAERASVPTLVVRDAAPFQDWCAGRRALRVFICFNSTVTSEAALRWLKELQTIGPCDVTVGYVDWPPEQRQRLGGSGSLPLVGNPPEVQAVLEREMSGAVRELLGDGPVKLRVEANWGRPDVRLAEMAREEQADLLVVGSHQYHGFERLWHMSVSRGLLHSAPMSVAVVPTPPEVRRRSQTIPQVRRVLASTDFSELGDRAIPHAYAAVPQGGVVKLVHVIPPWELPGPLVPHNQAKRLTKKQHLQLAADCARKLRSLAPPEADTRGITTEVEVLQHRKAAEAICEASERFGADRICLGTHGRSGLRKALLGSVAQKVLTLTQRPLLLVRPPQT